jgi:adenylate kinase family enzyme
VPSDPREIPYSSYREAKSKCKEGEEPIRRQDDSNLEVIKHRYYDLYLANCEQVMAIYRQNGLTKILEIDAQQPIEDNFQQILTFLRENY